MYICTKTVVINWNIHLTRVCVNTERRNGDGKAGSGVRLTKCCLGVCSRSWEHDVVCVHDPCRRSSTQDDSVRLV